MKCSEPECDKTATRELYGIPICEAYYVEAIEHCGHILSAVPKPIKLNLHSQNVAPQWTVEERKAQSKRIKESLALIGLQRLRLKFRQWKSRDWPCTTGIKQLSGLKAENAASFRKQKMKKTHLPCKNKSQIKSYKLGQRGKRQNEQYK